MATIDIHNLSGEKVGTLDLADEVFGAVNEDLLWEAVKHYRAAQRAGTHATKNKKLVSGAGKKLWKQKGTGRARVGSIRSPLWRHGGTVHGPQPRSYDYAFPRKKLLGALRSALAVEVCRWQADRGQCVRREGTEDQAVPRGAGRAEGRKHGAAGGSGEARQPQPGAELAQSRRASNWCNGNEVHPYHLLRYDRAIFSQPAIEKLQVSLKNSISKRQRKDEPMKESTKKATRAPRRRVRHEKAAEVA